MPEVRERIGLADLSRYEEELIGFIPEADANAMLPLVPAGDYVVSVKHLEEDPNLIWEPKIQESNNRRYLQTTLVCEIVENPMNPKDWVGRKIQHRVSTIVMSNSGTTSVQATIQGIGKGDRLLNRPKTNTVQAEVLTQELKSQPLAIAVVDWEFRHYDKEAKRETARIRGMRNFPFDPEDDERDPKKRRHTNVLASGDRGWDYIVRFKPLGSAKTTGTAPVAAGPDKAPEIPVVAPPPPVAKPAMRPPAVRPPTPTP